jgi:hypothetical protein
MNLEIEVREVYGRPLIYPLNDLAHAFAALEKTKTLSPAAIALAKRCGCTIEIKTAANKLAAELKGEAC